MNKPFMSGKPVIKDQSKFSTFSKPHDFGAGPGIDTSFGLYGGGLSKNPSKISIK